MQALEEWTLVILGLLLLGGYAAHVLGARVHVPRVTLLILLGIASGPFGLDLVPDALARAFPQVTTVTLAMVGFLLGERFTGRELQRTGRTVLYISIAVTLATATIMFGTFVVAGAPITLALLVAGIAPATAPGATVDIVRETRARGPLTAVTLGVVALDDVFGVMLFSIVLATAEAISGTGAPAVEVISGLWEVCGAVLLGASLGVPMAAVTGRLRRGEPAITEAIAFVFLCAGIAPMIGVSYILACMALGATVANRARHHTRPFHMMEGVSEPFLALFFVLAGVQFELTALAELGVMGTIYIIARIAGRLVGGYVGGRIAVAPPVVQSRVGWCLLPQAGVSLGLALIALARMPDVGGAILHLILATTVFFEIVGPLFTRWHLTRAGEVGR